MKGQVQNMSHPTSAPSPRLPVAPSSSGGWTLIELVITMTVMAVLTMAVIPIVRTSIRRQREQRLREALREMRGAIDEFHRDTVGMAVRAGRHRRRHSGGAGGQGDRRQGQGAVPIDPRSRVVHRRLHDLRRRQSRPLPAEP